MAVDVVRADVVAMPPAPPRGIVLAMVYYRRQQSVRPRAARKETSYVRGRPPVSPDSMVIDAIVPRWAEVETLLRGVPGFVAYYAVKEAQEGPTITVCADRAGTVESSTRAATWVRDNLARATGNQPEVIESDVVMDFRAKPAAPARPSVEGEVSHQR